MEAGIEQRQMMVAGVRFNKVGKLYHFEFGAFPELTVGDHVIVETARGRRMGQVMAFMAVNADDAREYKPIMRMATPRDLVLKQQWAAKEPEALTVCQEKADALGGYRHVKFVIAQYNYDGSVLTFMYSAEDRVEISRLHHELARHFPAAIEMRQVGPRDVAKLIGGGGACGKETRCCSSFLTDFSPISIKMAKVQGVSLNPSEITGMCGRLRCCLVYEYEQYLEARKTLPKRNKAVGTPFGEGRVIDIHPLQDAVSVYIPDVGVKLVERVDIVPLEEMRALAKKSAAPCDKHGDGPCECGAKPGKQASATADDNLANESEEE